MNHPSMKTTLITNASISAACGLLLLVLPAPVAAFTGSAPVWILQALGAALLLFALGVALVARGLPVSRPYIATILALDIGWVLATPVVMLLFRDYLNVWGHLLLIDAAVIVAVFAYLEWYWLRRIEVVS